MKIYSPDVWIRLCQTPDPRQKFITFCLFCIFSTLSERDTKHKTSFTCIYSSVLVFWPKNTYRRNLYQKLGRSLRIFFFCNYHLKSRLLSYPNWNKIYQLYFEKGMDGTLAQTGGIFTTKYCIDEQNEWRNKYFYVGKVICVRWDAKVEWVEQDYQIGTVLESVTWLEAINCVLIGIVSKNKTWKYGSMVEIRDGTEMDGIQFSRPIPGRDGMGIRI